MKALRFTSIFAVFSIFWGCTIERAQEEVISYHVNGAKKTSIWVYPDGEILKRNEWYTDGIKELEIPYKNNEPHGEFKRWDGYGDVAMIGEYKKGKRHGKWTSYYTNKKKEAVRYYEDDHAIGNWEGWFMDGKTSFEEHYSKTGDSVGVWKKWFPNGKLAEENSCFGTNPQGYYKKYNESEILEKDFNCKQGNKDGISQEYYSDGKKVSLQENWKDGRLDGLRQFFFANGNLQKKEFWKNGSRDAQWEWFDIDGNKIAETLLQQDMRTDFGVCEKEVCAETTFVANPQASGENHFVKDGKLWFMKDGRTLRYEETWQNGTQLESRSFYPDSVDGTIHYEKMASEGFWKDGKRNGVWRNWYKNGVLRDSLTYVNGERVGEQFSYDSTGRLTIHKTENGKNRPIIMHIPQ